MLDVTLHPSSDVDGIVRDFHLDGFACIADALTPDQLAYGQEGARRVVAEQTAATPLEKANRGYARYSFQSQIEHPEWRQLIDLQTTLPVLTAIWGDDFQCAGVGGDYSLPGARMQRLHSDIRDRLDDPRSRVTVSDLPSPFIVINFLMTEFTPENGPTRFVRGTHRSRHPIPDLEDEPEWMKTAVLCAPAGTAVVRDVRCWHGGTPNRSPAPRIMISAGYTAPWYRRLSGIGALPWEIYRNMSDRARELCRSIVALPH